MAIGEKRHTTSTDQNKRRKKRAKTAIQENKPEDAEIPEEYQDVIFQELAYDPVRLPKEEDPTQYLYDRRTLEKVWESSLNPLNPYTRVPFDISHVIPQTDLRQKMSQKFNSAELIQEYETCFTEQEMKLQLTELRGLVTRVRNKCSKKLWKAIWKKLNRIRLACQYREENKNLFQDMKGWQFIQDAFSKAKYLPDEPNTFQEGNDVYREFVWLLDVTDAWEYAIDSHLIHSIGIVTSEGYIRLDTMVLDIYRRIFSDYFCQHKIATEDFERFSKLCFCDCVVFYVIEFLCSNGVSQLTNFDFFNGISILTAFWKQQRDPMIHDSRLPDALAHVFTVLIARLQQNEIQDQAFVLVTLQMALQLISNILRMTNVVSLLSKQRFRELEIVKDIALMVDMAVSGFLFGDKVMELGVLCVNEVYQDAHDIQLITPRHVDSFAALLNSPLLTHYSPTVRDHLNRLVNSANHVILHL